MHGVIGMLKELVIIAEKESKQTLVWVFQDSLVDLLLN